MTFEDEMKTASAEIWKLFKPYLKDKPLTEEEWGELVKTASTVKYERIKGNQKAIDRYKRDYILLMLETVEQKQKEILGWKRR